jgi:hypothetical protein
MTVFGAKLRNAGVVRMLSIVHSFTRSLMDRRVWYFGLLVLVGCGGGSTGPAGNNGNNPPAGSVKVFAATINGAPFSGQTVVGAFLNGAGLTITANNGQGRSITISAINVPGPGTINFGLGNQWSALAQMIDNTQGTFSTGFGGTGTLTLTTATLFRIVGTFTFTAYTSAGTGVGNAVITVQNGTFDISNP